MNQLKEEQESNLLFKKKVQQLEETIKQLSRDNKDMEKRMYGELIIISAINKGSSLRRKSMN